MRDRKTDRPSLTAKRLALILLGVALFLTLASILFSRGVPTPPANLLFFELGGRPAAIEIEQGAGVFYRGETRDLVVIETRPGGRGAPQIVFRPSREADASLATDQSRALSESASIDYALSDSSGGSIGSGGPEAHLEGRLMLDGTAWTVSCSVQGENVDIDDADWCLAPLATLRMID